MPRELTVGTSISTNGACWENLSSGVLILPLTYLSFRGCYRIGRTGRAGRTGTATTFFMPHDAFKADQVSKVMALSGQEVPPWLEALAASASSSSSSSSLSSAPLQSPTATAESKHPKVRGDLRGRRVKAPASGAPPRIVGGTAGIALDKNTDRSGSRIRSNSRGSDHVPTTPTSTGQLEGSQQTSALPASTAQKRQGGKRRQVLRVCDIADAKIHPFGAYLKSAARAGSPKQSPPADTSSLLLELMNGDSTAEGESLLLSHHGPKASPLLAPQTLSQGRPEAAAVPPPNAEGAAPSESAKLLARWQAVIHGGSTGRSTTTTSM